MGTYTTHKAGFRVLGRAHTKQNNVVPGLREASCLESIHLCEVFGEYERIR